MELLQNLRKKKKKKKAVVEFVVKNFAATGWSWVTRRSSKKLVVV